MVKNSPATRQTWIQSLGWKYPLEEGKATHSSVPAWRIPWTEEPGGLQSTGSRRVRHDWATQHSTHNPHIYGVRLPLHPPTLPPLTPQQKGRDALKEIQDVMGVGGGDLRGSSSLFRGPRTPNPEVPNEAEPTATVAEGRVRTQLSGRAPHSSASSGQPPSVSEPLETVLIITRKFLSLWLQRNADSCNSRYCAQ